jgi:hypothetical protein
MTDAYQLLHKAMTQGVATVEWCEDEDALGDQTDDPETNQALANGDLKYYECWIEIHDEPVAGCGSIILETRDVDGDPYTIEIESELAAECEDALRAAMEETR